MGRHSLHANDRSHFSHKERADAGYGFTKKVRIDSAGFLPFGFCAVSLKAPKDPVATPDGHIYDREAILQHLLSEKQELLAQHEKFQKQEKSKERTLAAEKQEANLRELEFFQRNEEATMSQDKRHKRAADQLDSAREQESLSHGGSPGKKLRKGELMTIDKADMRSKSFWSSEFTPTAAPTAVKKVDLCPKCPMSGKKLRVKDLIHVNFEAISQKVVDQGGEHGWVCCAVTKHAITHQQAILIKPSGVVVLESILKDIVFPTMTCPITGKKIEKKEDLLKLQRGKTGFSAHNEVEAKSFSIIRSRQSDDLLRQGHLGAKGTCL